MGEIMFQINNSQRFKKFEVKEKVIRVIFGCVITISFIQGCWVVNFMTHGYNYYVLMTLSLVQLNIPNVMMFIVSIILLFNLRKYYSYQFKRMNLQIIGFTFYLTSVNFVVVSLKYFGLPQNLHDIFIRMLYYQGYGVLV